MGLSGGRNLEPVIYKMNIESAYDASAFVLADGTAAEIEDFLRARPAFDLRNVGTGRDLMFPTKPDGAPFTSTPSSKRAAYTITNWMRNWSGIAQMLLRASGKDRRLTMYKEG